MKGGEGGAFDAAADFEEHGGASGMVGPGFEKRGEVGVAAGTSANMTMAFGEGVVGTGEGDELVEVHAVN